MRSIIVLFKNKKGQRQLLTDIKRRKEHIRTSLLFCLKPPQGPKYNADISYIHYVMEDMFS